MKLTRYQLRRLIESTLLEVNLAGQYMDKIGKQSKVYKHLSDPIVRAGLYSVAFLNTEQPGQGAFVPDASILKQDPWRKKMNKIYNAAERYVMEAEKAGTATTPAFEAAIIDLWKEMSESGNGIEQWTKNIGNKISMAFEGSIGTGLTAGQAVDKDVKESARDLGQNIMKRPNPGNTQIPAGRTEYAAFQQNVYLPMSKFFTDNPLEDESTKPESADEKPSAGVGEKKSSGKGWDGFVKRASDPEKAQRLADKWNKLARDDKSYKAFVRWYNKARTTGETGSPIGIGVLKGGKRPGKNTQLTISDVLGIFSDIEGSNYLIRDKMVSGGFTKDDAGLNESLSRGSLYRKRYRRY